MKKAELEFNIKQTNIESLEADLKLNYENIKKMHEQNQGLEEELIYLRHFQKNINPIIEERDAKIAGLTN